VPRANIRPLWQQHSPRYDAAMGTAPDAIKRLVEHFDHQRDQVRSPDYNEAQLRIDFINPMFRELGWDVDNTQGFAEQYREVVSEDRLKVGGQTKAPDYSFRVGGPRKFFLEAKKPSVNIKENWEPAYQLRRYGWSAKLAVSLLTNFEEFAVYDCRIQPKQLEKASTARREYITYRQYEDRWDFLSGTFSKQAVLRGDFDRYCTTTRGRGAQEFDDAFLFEIEEWRMKLAANLALRNDDLNERSLNFAVQRIIDRIIFLRICEDRGIERVGRLQALLNADNIYARLGELFQNADDRYNSGLFHFKTEKGRDESPDELTLGLDVDDAALKSIIRRLYYPESPYEFTVVSADILGSVYERFLGKIITLTPGHRAKVEEKPEVRKAGGVYYTPTYIVDYIVEQTVGKLLESAKTPREAAKLTILDPACGSGSFLLGAYQFLLDWHLKWYTDNAPENWSKGKKATLRPGPDGQWRLTINERKRILLDNIHGVDIDYQAVEVTKLSLLLKVLEGETAESLGGLWTHSHERALPDLGRNIQCGNSLIGTDIMETEAWDQMSENERQRINVFDYERGFVRAFKQGGFDAVIGNPPYGAYASNAEAEYLRKKYATLANSLDTFIMFVEHTRVQLRIGGIIGMIIPSGWVSTPSSRPLREFFLANFSPQSFVSLPFDVFEGAYIDCVIFTAARRKAGPPSHGPVRLVVFPHRHRIKGYAEFDARTVVGSSLGWAESPEKEFLITLSSGGDAILEKMRGQLNVVGDFVEIKRGIETYVLVNSKRKVKRPRLAFDGILQRYVLRPSEPRFLSYTDDIEASKPWRFFSSPRLLLRQVLSRKLRLQAAFTADPFLTNQSVQSLVAIEGNENLLKPLLALLNSRLLSWFFVTVNSAARRDDFPKIIIKQTRELPIPKFDRHRQRRLIALVDAMTATNARLSVEKLPQRREQFQRQIDATDRQIDRLVYELYGLTDDEIRIVEEATAGD
jgi:hypothetical protein